MTLNAWVGIDPGIKGYSCLLVPEMGLVDFKPNTDLPLDICTWYSQVALKFNLRIVLIEDVRNIFGVSSRSNFQFGYNTGLITGIVKATGLGMDRVAPKAWQKRIGITSKGKDIKKEVASKAIELYPYATVFKPRGSIDTDKTDALMITHTARIMYP